MPQLFSLLLLQFLVYFRVIVLEIQVMYKQEFKQILVCLNMKNIVKKIFNGKSI